MKRISVLILLFSNLYGFSIVLKPGWNCTNTPSSTIQMPKNLSRLNIGLQIGHNLSSVFGMQFSCTYNPRHYLCEVRNEDDVYLGTYNLRLSELYLGYDNSFTIPLHVVNPYFILGTAIKFGLYAFDNKTSWHLTFGHGYKIKPVPYFVIMPEVAFHIALSPRTEYHGLFITLGLGCEF